MSTCPCTLVEPCSYACSCARPTMSGGCQRCATYGSEEQQLASAKHIAEKLSARPEALRSGWRDPKDKPPHLPGEHHSEDVLLSMNPRTSLGYEDHGIRIGHVSCGHWRPAGGNGNFDAYVLGWMPLPVSAVSPLAECQHEWSRRRDGWRCHKCEKVQFGVFPHPPQRESNE